MQMAGKLPVEQLTYAFGRSPAQLVEALSGLHSIRIVSTLPSLVNWVIYALLHQIGIMSVE
jgi:hypothetical protein